MDDDRRHAVTEQIVFTMLNAGMDGKECIEALAGLLAAILRKAPVIVRETYLKQTLEQITEQARAH